MGRKENEEHPAGRDAVAEALEAAGLYRRAARRWLECWTGARTVRSGPGWLPVAVSVWKMPESLNRRQSALVMYARRRLTRRNEWVSMHRTGSESIPLTVAPPKKIIILITVELLLADNPCRSLLTIGEMDISSLPGGAVTECYTERFATIPPCMWYRYCQERRWRTRSIPGLAISLKRRRQK